jgi:GNAT superfamily N-acetyltransferase
MTQSTLLVRPGVPSDGPTFLSLVCALADFENLAPPDEAAQQRLLDDAFVTRRFDLLIAEVDGKPAGYAVIFETYSTFLAQPKLYLEDLFVLPDFRGKGAGLALMQACAREGLARGCARMEWQVLDWNHKAMEFYEGHNARHQSQWLTYTLGTEGLKEMAGKK